MQLGHIFSRILKLAIAFALGTGASLASAQRPNLNLQMTEMKMSGPTKKSSPQEEDRSGEYGGYTGLVELIKKYHTEENAKAFAQLTPPVKITPYNKWQPSNMAKIFEAFPNIYNDFKSLLVNATNKNPQNELETKDKNDAIKAMAELSGDGNPRRYAGMIIEAVKIVEQNTKDGKAPQKPSYKLGDH